MSVHVSVGNLLLRLWVGKRVNDMVQPLDSTVSGFAATSEAVPKTEVGIDLAADTVGQAQLVKMRAGQFLYVRVKSVGPIIESTTHFSLQWDLALKITSVAEYKSVSNSLLGVGYTCQLAHDATAGKALSVTLVTDEVFA